MMGATLPIFGDAGALRLMEGESVVASVYEQESMHQSTMSVQGSAVMTHTRHATSNGGSVHGGKSLPNTQYDTLYNLWHHGAPITATMRIAGTCRAHKSPAAGKPPARRGRRWT